MRSLICVTLTILVSVTEAVKDTVPVLIWNIKKSPQSMPDISALQVVSYESFQEKYLNSFPLQNVLLFMQESLSVEDLSSHADELKHVSDWTGSGHSLFLPAVEDASHLALSLPAQGYKLSNLEPGSSVAGITLNKNENNLVLVRLPSTVHNLSRSKALLYTDEVIESVISKIGHIADFTIIFTGSKSSLISDSENGRRTSFNSFEKADNSTSQFHKTECVLLYLKNSIVITKGEESYTLLESNSDGNGSSECGEKEAIIRLEYINVDQIGDVSVKLQFISSSRHWWLNQSEVYEGAGETPTATLMPHKPMDKVPLGKSYACAQNIIMTTDTENYTMTISGVQVEAFTTADAIMFHDGWDCMGFFTVPIWTGILTGILLTFILLFGIYMLGDIKTMDRFEDPKGKYCYVATASD